MACVQCGALLMMTVFSTGFGQVYVYVPEESTYFVKEGMTREVKFVLLNPPATGLEFDFNVTLFTTDGQAKAGEDYVMIPGAILSSPNGTLSINVTVIDDAVVELPENFYIIGQVLGESVSVVFDDRLQISILSDDSAIITYEESAYTVVEGRTIEVCLSPITEELEASITVKISVKDGSATEDEDYVAEEIFVTFGPNMPLNGSSGSGERGGANPPLDTSSGSDLFMESGCIAIRTERERALESDENFFVTTEGVKNANLVVVDQMTVTILDATIVVEQKSSGLVIPTSEQGSGVVTLCAIVVDGTLFDEAEIILTTTDITAREGLDYLGGKFSLTLQPGDNTVCANVTIIDDDLIEDAEWFAATISSEETFVIIRNPSTTVKIAGNDGHIIPCSRERDCSNTFQESSVVSCCMQEDALSYIPVLGAEACFWCYVYGWVDNISPNGESASPQPVITAEEGETITLNIYYTKNGQWAFTGIRFTIETGGTATLNEDYTLSYNDPVLSPHGPTRVNVTLLNDRVTGEGMETILLTLHEISGPDHYILGHETAIINIHDNSVETGFEASEITVIEGTLDKVCLITVGPLIDDTVINVTLMEGSAVADDLRLHTQQVTLTAVNPEPCISFTAVADYLGLEGQEMLTLSLSGPSNITLRNVSLTIIIDDSDVVTIGFKMTAYEVTEGETVNLVVQKSGPVEHSIAFRVFSAGLIDQEWAFAAGAAASDTVTISISQDDDISLERDEIRVVTLQLSLVNPDPRILVSPSQTNVTIIDNDSTEVDNNTTSNPSLMIVLAVIVAMIILISIAFICILTVCWMTKRHRNNQSYEMTEHVYDVLDESKVSGGATSQKGRLEMKETKSSIDQSASPNVYEQPPHTLSSAVSAMSTIPGGTTDLPLPCETKPEA